jgi:hypothetical protein
MQLQDNSDVLVLVGKFSLSRQSYVIIRVI